MWGPVSLSQTTIDAQYGMLRAYLTAQARLPEFNGISVTTDLLTGPVAATLLAAIEREHTDLVVMNSHGRGAWPAEHWEVLPIASWKARTCPC
jgi:hypothetical protein